MGKTRPRFGLEEGKVAEVDKSGCGGCGSPLAKNRQPPEPGMTPLLSFLKTTKKCTAVAVPRAAPVWALRCLACPQSGAWIMLIPWKRFWA